MDRTFLRPFLRFLLGLYKWLMTSYAIVYAGLKAAWREERAKAIPEALGNIWSMIDAWGWTGVALGALTTAPVVWVSKRIQPEQAEKILKAVLADYTEKVLPPGATDWNFRVTLFKHRRFSSLQLIKWLCLRSTHAPWAGWLCPYSRPGQLRTHSWTRWHADLQDPKRCEGFAGQVFCSSVPLSVEGLPSRDEVKSQPKKKALYCERSTAPAAWVEQKVSNDRGLFPRSFYGFRVMIDDKPWGVLMIDSEQPEFPSLDALNLEAIRIAKLLKPILTTKP